MALPVKPKRPVPKHGASGQDGALEDRWNRREYAASEAQTASRNAAFAPPTFRPGPILDVPPPAEAARQLEAIRRRRSS